MANQQVGVNMKFTADTSQAKTQLQDLQSSLTRIMDVSRKNDPTLGFSKEIQNAINLTAELKTSLTNATNVKTGQLDLSKFNDSLVKNKRTLKDYQNALTSLGPAGNQAFSDLASSIMKAEIPLKRTNKLLADFAITMKNTVKWQISSNIMHGLEGSIKSAYGYAQDLNKSLNDIRIVTGASVNEMARFAEQANKSARALSTTTTDYTKASLIYYQQGLSDSEVQERTDVTIKMANVARESAEIVSDQMTAVWNNFDDGSKSLEYYADVMTALGAATASSTDEIAAGLEKFAAVSETVGLSYEYATAALATVTDKTRQSADVVGTAFKAMFARIQGLKLGETLEDGTDLNQYSKALLAVGVNIKDANGELKDMDSILNEMAAVWEKLNRDEQVALAQKVAGVRQYNQLMSLMENWDAMEINLEVAKNSEGELQKQADIYAESWEAATDRVKAAAESIYQTLINDEFFIDLTNALEKILVGVKKLMDSMGGLPGVLTLVGSIATNVFNKQLADGFDNLIYRIRMSTDEGRKEIEDLKHEASQLLTAEWTDRDTTSGLIAGNAYKEQGQLQGILLANAEKLSAEEQKQVQYLMDQHSSLVSQVVKSGEALEIEQQKAKLLERRMIAEAQLAAGERSNHKVSGVEVHRKSLEGITELYYKISSISLTGNMEKDAQSFQRLNKIIAELKGNTVQLGKEGQLAVNQLANGLKNGTLTAKDLDNILLQLEKQQVISMNGLITALEKCGIEGKDATNIARQLRDQYDNLGVASAETSEKQIQLGNSTKSVADKIKNAKGEIVTLGSMFSSTMNAVTNFGFALSSIKGIIDTLNNEDLTFFEKLVSVLISTSMIIGSFTSILKTVNDIRKMATSGEIKNTTAKTLNAAATWLQAKAEKALGDELDRNNKKKTTSSKINLKDAKNTGKRVSVKLIEKTGQVSQNAAGAVNTLGAAFGNFVSSLKMVLPLLGKYIAIAGVVVAIISAITYSIHKGIEKYNEDAIAAKNAEEAAQELAKAYSEVKNKYEEMISTMDGYKSAREGLDNLTKGTNEYREQLIKANDEALKLIQLLGLIKGEGFDVNDGEIIINTESSDYQEKISQLLKDTQKAQAASLMARATADIAKSQENQTELVRKNDKEVIKNNMLAWSANGAVLGSFLGPKGALAGAIPGLVAGLYEGVSENIKSNKAEQEKINKLTEDYKKEGNSVFTNLDEYGFNSSNEEYIKAIENQVKANVDGANSLKTASQIASAALLELNKNIQNSEKKDKIQQVAERLFEKDYTGWQEIDKGKLTSNWFGIGTADQKEIWQEYKNTALKNLEDVQVTNYRADGGVDYTYTKYDEQGQPQKEKGSASAETISAWTANEKASNNILAASDLWLSAFQKLDIKNDKQAAAISSSLSEGNLSNISLTDLESFSIDGKTLNEKILEKNSALGKESAEAYLKGFNSDELTGFNTDDFIAKIDKLLTPEELQALGYNDAGEYALAFQQQYWDAMAEWKGLEQFKDQSLGEAQKLNTISETLGGTEKTDTQVLDYYEGLNEEEKTIFLNLDFNKEKTEENWNKAIADIKEKKIEVQIETKASEAASDYDLDSKQVEDLAKAYSKLNKVGKGANKTTEDIAEQATDAAVRYTRLQKAVLDLSENYDDYSEILKDIKKETNSVNKAYLMSSESSQKLRKSLSNLLGTSEDLIDADVVSAIDPSDFKKAAAGDEAAISRIRDAFIDAQVASTDFKGEVAENLNISEAAEDFKSMIAGLSDGAVIDIDNTPFLTALIQSQLMAGKTAPEIEALLSGFGIDADVTPFVGSMEEMKAAAEGASNAVIQNLSYSQETETEAVTEESDVNQIAWAENYTSTSKPFTHTVLMDGNSEPKEVTTVLQKIDKNVTQTPVTGTQSKTVTATTSNVTNGEGVSSNVKQGGVKISNATKSVGNKVNPSTARTAGNNLNKGKGGGGGGGGGGSKPKPAKPTKKSDIVDRYKEQDDQLDDLKRTMDNAEKSLEKLYGDDKAKAIEKLIAAEREYKDVLKEKRSEARDALKEDRKALNAAASKVSVEFEYDAEGNLINYTEQMEALYSRLRAVEKAAGSEWTESEQEQIDALKEKIEALKEAQEQYESTRELIEDISDELKDLAGKPAMPLIKSDYIDIYREIIDALDDIDKRLERLAKRADDLMGSKRLKQFKQFEGTSEEKLALIDEELSKNKTDIKQNKTYLKRVSKLLDVNTPKYDKKGNIVNSDEVLNVLWNRVLKVQKRAKKDGKISKAEQEAIDARLAEIDMYTSARDKYSDAVEYRKDLNAEKKEITDKVTVLPVVTNDFLDIYKEADDILDDIEHKASKIADESERATGKDKVAKLKELAKTEKERYQYIKKAQEINTSDKAEKKAAMEKAASSLKIPIKFAYDGNGNITNYNEIKQYYEQQYAAAYAEAMKDGFINADERDWLEQFKSDGETIEEYIQKYSEAVDQGEDLEEQAREAEQAAEDYILEALSYTVELNIEADERDLKLIEYQLSQLEDQGYATAEAMDLIDKKYTSLMNQSTSYTKGIDSIFKKYIDEGKLTQKAVDAFWNGDASGINWSIFSEAEIDKINEYSDGIMTVSESLMELRKTMDEAVISAFEEWTAEMKEQLSLFDHYESIINSYNNITDLVGQERLGISDEDRKKYNDLRIDNATNRLASSKTYFDETKEKITKAEIEKAAAEARLAAAQSSGDESLIKAAEKDVKMWEDTLKVMYQENRDAEQQYLADWEAALQASRDAFLAETEMELEAFEKKMAGVYGSFDNMQKEFNRQSEKNDRYLQDYEKLYELSKLNRDLSNKIDDTTNLKAKKELAKLQEEILEYQKDGVKMSDYDLKFLQKRYDLKLAEIALEEAQNAKTQVRLTRDSEGNYSYTYTADEDSIAKAQQNYEDKLYEISNLSNEYIEQQTSKLLSTQQAFVNELAEIHKKAAEGQYATTEEYQQALDDCSAYYTEQLAYYGDEIDKAANNNSTVYENDYLNYEGWMLEKIRKTEEDADAYIAGALNKSAAEAGFITSVRDLLPELEQAHIDATGYVSAMTTEIGSAEEGTGLLGASRQSYEDYGLKIDDVMMAAGSSTETFKDKVSEYLLTGEDSVANSSDEARQKIEEMALAVTDLDKTIANVSAWQTSYSGEIQKAIDKTAEFIGQINDMNQSLADKAEEEAQKSTPKPNPVTPTLENPVTNVGKEKKCPKCKQPLSKCKCGKNPPKTNPSKDEKKCPKCGKKPCQCKKIAQKKAEEEEARRKAEEKAKKKKKLKADARAIVIGVNNGTIKQTDAGWRPSAEKAGYSKKAIQLALDAFNQSPSYNYPTALDYIKAYNTGGYTGSWGAEGKLAMLHEKELVLNKEDTENMLKMVSMVRDIVSVLDIKAYQASLAQLAANQLSPMTNSQNAFEQTVTIHAEFPDAIYANEIETALNNLVNSASQFANRKY